MAVQQLYRQAAVGIAQLNRLLHRAAVGLVGKFDLYSERIEKAYNQRRVIVHAQRPRHTNGDAGARHLVVVSEKHFLALIEKRRHLGVATHAVKQVAAATVEGGLFIGNIHAAYGAVVIAGLAGKGGHLVLAVDDMLEPFELRAEVVLLNLFLG